VAWLGGCTFGSLCIPPNPTHPDFILSSIFFLPSTCSLGLLFPSPPPSLSAVSLEGQLLAFHPPLLFYGFSPRNIPSLNIPVISSSTFDLQPLRPIPRFSFIVLPHATHLPPVHPQTHRFYPTRVPFFLFVCFHRAWVSCHI
jgi:hypothetical protein